MKQLVRHTIRQYHMLPDGARVLCGLSGGADSVSLVLCLLGVLAGLYCAGQLR